MKLKLKFVAKTEHRTQFTWGGHTDAKPGSAWMELIELVERVIEPDCKGAKLHQITITLPRPAKTKAP